MPRYLLNAFGDLEKMTRGKKLSLFLDYDGTLTPIVATPEQASLPYPTRELLKKIKGIFPTAIISGREINDLRKRVALDGIVYAGNHGFEIYAEDFSFHTKGEEGLKADIADITGRLKDSLEGMKGAIVEHKGLTTSIHYRLVDEREVPQLLTRVRRELLPYTAKGGLRITEGKKVIEVRPAFDWDKGRAVCWIMGQERFRETIPLYIGDDETDRDALRELKETGIFIVVGHRWTNAHYFLKHQGEVEKLLEWLTSAAP